MVCFPGGDEGPFWAASHLAITFPICIKGTPWLGLSFQLFLLPRCSLSKNQRARASSSSQSEVPSSEAAGAPGSQNRPKNQRSGLRLYGSRGDVGGGGGSVGRSPTRVLTKFLPWLSSREHSGSGKAARRFPAGRPEFLCPLPRSRESSSGSDPTRTRSPR